MGHKVEEKPITVLHINCNYMNSWLHQTMIEQLNRLGINNRVYVPVYTLSGHKVVPNKSVVVSKCFRKWDRVLYSYKQSKIFRDLLNKEAFDDVDCVHAYTTFTDGNNARKIYEKFNIPYFVAVRNTDVNTFFKRMPMLRHIGVRVLHEARMIFFLSEAYKKEVLEKYVPKSLRAEIEKKSLIMPNGIDDFWFSHIGSARECDAKKTKKLRIIYVGNVDKNKNIGLTLQAMELLQKQNWGISLSVIGKVVDNGEYENLKRPDVTYYPPMPKEQLIHMFQSSDIFIMPSHTESFGLVYAEAMSQGLPVIYTRGQGFDGHFADGRVGYAVSDRNAAELADKIVAVTENYREISRNALQGVTNFRWDNICEHYVQIYRDTIKDNRSPLTKDGCSREKM